MRRDDEGVHKRILGFGAVGLVLIFAAGTILLLQVRVQASGISAPCGAPFDVISGRANWQRWFSTDLTDPRISAARPLVRTEACPTAVNRRTTVAGILAVTGLGLVTGAALLAARDRRRRTQPIPLRTLGALVTGVGAALTVAGFIGLVVLLGRRDAPLFFYVDRWVVAIIGMLVLIPAIALAGSGRALMLFADARVEDRTDHDAS